MQRENWISVDVGWCLVFRSGLQVHKDQFSDCSVDLASKDCSEVAAETELSLLMNIGELPSVLYNLELVPLIFSGETSVAFPKSVA